MAGINPPKLYGEFTTTSSMAVALKVGANPKRTITVPAGTYFIETHGGTPADSSTGLLNYLQSAATGFRQYAELAAMTLDIGTTGLVTVANGSTFIISKDTVAAAGIILGWWDGTTGVDGYVPGSADSSTATSHVGAEQARYTWFPNVPPSDMTGDPDLIGVITSDAKVTRSPAGQVTSTSYREWTDREFEFQWLEDEYVYPTGSVEYRDYESFWQDCRTKRIRYYYDRTVETAPDGTGPWEYKMAQRSAAGGTGQQMVKRAKSDVWKWHHLTLAVHKYVSG